jgi:6-pyruvoyltetrahydropterin/6-carboxytetrahydropterin synthase
VENAEDGEDVLMARMLAKGRAQEQEPREKEHRPGCDAIPEAAEQAYSHCNCPEKTNRFDASKPNEANHPTKLAPGFIPQAATAEAMLRTRIRGENAVPTCTRRLQFAAGHRVLGHENKCANVHGHNYVVEITACADALDGIGRVIDFSVLKERIGGWIEEHWDHGFILYSEDADVVLALMQVPGTKTYGMPANPTAENMADFLLRVVGPLVLTGTGVHVTRVVVHETENCWAEAVL